MARDHQRQKVYDAEPHMGGRRFESVADAERYVDHLLGMKIVRRKFGARWTPPGSIAVIGGGAGGAAYFSTRLSRRSSDGKLAHRTIVMSRSRLDEHTLLHELSHHLTRGSADGAHGWQFCDAMLWLVRNRLGREAAESLRLAYRRTGARYLPPRPKRTLSPEQAEAARARLAKVRADREAKLAAERGEWLIEWYYDDGRGKSSPYRWAVISGSGSRRGVRYWTTWPPNATVYRTISGAERWAAPEREGWAAPEREGRSTGEVRIVSLADAQAHYDEAVAARAGAAS